MPRVPVPREWRDKDAEQNGAARGRYPSHLNPIQKHLIAASGEFVGTFFFLYFSYMGSVMLTTQASDASISNGGTSSQTNIFAALIYGFSLLVNVWAFYRISGGLFNPAASLHFPQLPYDADSSGYSWHVSRWHITVGSSCIPISCAAASIHVCGWPR
jgi:aquaporin rerated protein, other eukaryote